MMLAGTSRMRGLVSGWAADGAPVRKIVANLASIDRHHTNQQIYQFMIRHKIPRKGWSSPDEDKINIMVKMYKAGKTLQYIGDEFNVTRERVRQLMTKHRGVTSKDGGQSVTAEENSVAKRSAAEVMCFKKHGCSVDQRRWLLKNEPGASRAFSSQKQNARVRGIGWDFNLWSWWMVWLRSGKWPQRGVGQGYVMARFNDEGNYHPDNVKIILSIENISTSKSKKSGLPCGVTKRGKFFIAQRQIEGEKHYAGPFPTPELAGQAYIDFGNARNAANVEFLK